MTQRIDTTRWQGDQPTVFHCMNRARAMLWPVAQAKASPPGDYFGTLQGFAVQRAVAAAICAGYGAPMHAAAARLKAKSPQAVEARRVYADLIAETVQAWPSPAKEYVA